MTTRRIETSTQADSTQANSTQADSAKPTQSTTADIEVPAALNRVIAAETAIGAVDGEAGSFHFRGVDATELARTASFEEVWFLIHEGHPATPDELASFRTEVAEARQLPAALEPIIDVVAANPGSMLGRLRTVLSAASGVLGLEPVLDLTPEHRKSQALQITALVPTVLAALSRRAEGHDLVEADPTLGHAANYLYQTTGVRPLPEHGRAVERYMILTIDHGFNASTFTARVVASTGADVADAVCAALGALAGPLHGGAPSRALDALDAIGSADRARAWVRGQLDQGRKIMGFGHAVYRAPDPRSGLLRRVAEELGGELVERAMAIESEILAALAEAKPGRPLPSNVEFYAGVVMETAGLPRHMFTPTFAVSRTVGWSAHIVEQAAQAKLIRPTSRYIGEPGLDRGGVS